MSSYPIAGGFASRPGRRSPGWRRRHASLRARVTFWHEPKRWHMPSLAETTIPAVPISPVLDTRSKHRRRLGVRALEGGGRGHVGSSMSLIEILRVLYDDVLRFRPSEPKWPDRDRMILSTGHGCLARYVILADKGFISPDTLDTFCHRDSILGGHPEAGKVSGVEASTGA